MIKLNNLAGTIMNGATEIARFKYDHDRLVSCELLCKDKSLLPIEFSRLQINDWLIRCFFDARIVPETRIGLQEDLEKVGIPYYDPETIIRYQKGRSFGDPYWLKC